MTKENKTVTVSKRTKTGEKTQRLAMLGLLTAITLIMGLTPLGFIPIGALQITFVTIPVIVAAALMSPADAAIIGGVFGMTSFIQAFRGASFLTGALFQINPLLTFLLCVVPRVLEGLLGGLIFQGMKKIDKTKFFSYVVTSLSVPVLNTILFMSALYAELRIIMSAGLATDQLDGKFASTFAAVSGSAASDVISFFIALVGTQAIIEAAVCFVLGTAITKSLAVALKRVKK